MVEVTDADRELAIELLVLNGHAFSAQLVLEGAGDKWPDVQAIARHRLTASQSSAERIASLEARVAELEAGVREIAGQHLPDEMEEPSEADFEGGYIACVERARLLNKGSEPCPK